jgi:hypothetical protein
MKCLFRVISATVFLCVAGFCVFGFLASFEVGWISIWHGIYGICGIASLAIAMRLLRSQIKGDNGATTVVLPLAAGGMFSLAVLLLWISARLLQRIYN